MLASFKYLNTCNYIPVNIIILSRMSKCILYVNQREILFFVIFLNFHVENTFRVDNRSRPREEAAREEPRVDDPLPSCSKTRRGGPRTITQRLSSDPPLFCFCFIYLFFFTIDTKSTRSTTQRHVWLCDGRANWLPNTLDRCHRASRGRGEERKGEDAHLSTRDRDPATRRLGGDPPINARSRSTARWRSIRANEWQEGWGDGGSTYGSPDHDRSDGGDSVIRRIALIRRKNRIRRPDCASKQVGGIHLVCSRNRSNRFLEEVGETRIYLAHFVARSIAVIVVNCRSSIAINQGRLLLLLLSLVR